MATVAVIGDGPGGLSAALFLAKNGHDVTVYGLDKTAVHFAHLYNYLGVPDIAGSDFQAIARDQVAGFGASLIEAEVTAVTSSAEGFNIDAGEDGMRADYVIFTEGRNPVLAKALGVAMEDDRIVVDADGRSSIDRAYVIGRSARPTRSQAIISAGDGAASALDILAREAGSDVQDWDTPDED